MQKRWDASPRRRAGAHAALLAAALLALAAFDLARRRRPPPAGARAGDAEAARRRARPPRCRSAGTRPSARRATTCASPATAASGRRCRRCALRGVKTQLLLLPGRWFWKVRAAGKINSRWSNIRQVVVRPKGDPYPPTRPTALRVTAVAENSVTRDVRRLARTTAASRATSCWRATARCSRAASSRPDHRTGPGLRDDLRLPRARARRRRPRLARLPGRARADARLHRSRWRRPRPANMRAITVADTSVALAWDPAVDADGTVRALRRLPQRRPARAARRRPASSRAASRRPTPYRFTVAAIDGAGHRSPDGVLDTATLAPLPATGPAYAYMLASTGKSFEDLQRHYRQIAVVSPTYYHARPRPLDPRRGRPARDELGAPARHRHRAARRVAGSDDPAQPAHERGQPHEPRRGASPRSSRRTATTASTSTSRPARPPIARC